MQPRDNFQFRAPVCEVPAGEFAAPQAVLAVLNVLQVTPDGERVQCALRQLTQADPQALALVAELQCLLTES